MCPLATVVIGGIVTWTFLTLLVLPSVCPLVCGHIIQAPGEFSLDYNLGKLALARGERPKAQPEKAMIRLPISIIGKRKPSMCWKAR